TMKKFTKFIIGTALFGLLLVGCQSSSGEEQEADSIAEGTEVTAAETADTTVASAAVFNANLATEADLTAAGLSADLIKQIIENRPFMVMNDLDALVGEDLDKEALYRKIFVPFNLNTTAEADFQLIPGVGDRMAHEFEEYRPYSNMEQFKKEIGKYVDDKELARLERFVYIK
ncbi:MAG: helix-hairpin-helix domain-containing protein, partial [Saprospiraceae bacterium]|nr:helix-hairpin-helix domain-containing protein [Saprospiraceae bacterium]